MAVPILLYHALTSENLGITDIASVSCGDFQRQMSYLHNNGFTGVSLAKMLAQDFKGVPEGKKKFVLTFDGGDISHYNFAFPLLKSLGFSATFFVTINEIGKERKMDWEMIYELAHQGMDVGSMGLTNTFLTSLPNYMVLNELLASKQILEKYTRRRVDFLSAPGGFVNKRVAGIAGDVGFKALCGTDFGYNNFSPENLWCLKRFFIRHRYSVATVKALAQGQIPLGVIIFETVRLGARKILGPQVYEYLGSWKVKTKTRLLQWQTRKGERR